VLLVIPVLPAWILVLHHSPHSAGAIFGYQFHQVNPFTQMPGVKVVGTI